MIYFMEAPLTRCLSSLSVFRKSECALREKRVNHVALSFQMRCLRFLLRVQLQVLSILASFSLDLTNGLFTPKVFKFNSTTVSKSAWEEVFGKGCSDLEVASLNNT